MTTFAAETHVGCRRSNNEDAFLVEPDSGLYVVCDGMGGHDCGEVASRLAVSEIRAGLEREMALDDPADDASRAMLALGRAITSAHVRIRRESEERELLVHMGTTVVATVVQGESAVVANVGDSRAYLVGKSGHRLLTRDHTVARLYAQAGLIAEEAVDTHPLRGVLVRCLGAPDGCEPDVAQVPFGAGDRLLLCSDGLTEMVPEVELVEIVREGKDPESIVNALIAAALSAGGDDNVTALVVERC